MFWVCQLGEGGCLPSPWVCQLGEGGFLPSPWVPTLCRMFFLACTVTPVFPPLRFQPQPPIPDVNMAHPHSALLLEVSRWSPLPPSARLRCGGQPPSGAAQSVLEGACTGGSQERRMENVPDVLQHRWWQLSSALSKLLVARCTACTSFPMHAGRRVQGKDGGYRKTVMRRTAKRDSSLCCASDLPTCTCR